MRSGCIAFFVLLFAVAIGAQKTLFLKFGQFTPKGRQLRASVDFVDAGQRVGGFGYALIRLDNVDQEKHRVALVLAHSSSRHRMYRFTRELVIEAGASERVFLPLPNGDLSMALSLSVDGFQAQTTRHSSGSGLMPSVLLISEDPKAQVSWEARLKGLALTLTPGAAVSPGTMVTGRMSGSARVSRMSGRGRGGASVLLRRRAPEDLPLRWEMLSGFDALIVDGRSLGTIEQGVLRKYLRTGGRICVYHADVVPEGELSRDWQASWEQGGQWGMDGFGSWIAIGSKASAHLPGGPLPEPVSSSFDEWLGVSGTGGFFEARHRPLSGPATCKGYLPAEIPNLGNVSLRLFFLFTLAFGVLVGPVSYIYWMKKRKLPMLLLTVPLMGFGCTCIILLYGLFSEGLGVKGVIRSVTLLDQTQHEAVTWSSRTLYAGLAPGALVPAAETSVSSLHLNYDWNKAALHSYEVDLTSGRKFGGGLVPSRYPTCLVATSLGTARDRLRIKRRDDGGFDLLSAPDFQASQEDGDVVLRDFDGQYYISKADHLVSLGGGKAASVNLASSALKDLLLRWDQAGALVLASTGASSRLYYPSSQSGLTLLPIHQSAADSQSSATGFWSERVMTVLKNGMAKGSYLAIVTSDPCVDDLGIESTWLESRQLVLGSMSKEDVIE